ncbi:MAG: RnfABCDGE type electron transport complex subunit G [Treponema sp.]|nr:RnfABCDGE type electron transport complex subunit G [Treponema sp.]
MNYLLKPSITLFVTAVVSIAVISVAHRSTLEPIQQQLKRSQETALAAVLPQADSFEDLKLDVETIGLIKITAVFEGFSGGEKVGYVLSVSSPGYSGSIDLMVGISYPEETIAGIWIVRHSETPGLGARAQNPSFYERYINRPLVRLGVVRSSPGENDVVALTSSTITTRAVTDAVNEAIGWYNRRAGK